MGNSNRSCPFLKINENDNKDFMQDKDMNKNVGADKDKFTISCYGIELPFEWYSMEYILKELGNSKLYFKNVVKMEKATNEKIKKYYKENEENLGENNRFFIYIKFFNVNGKNYGIVAGKTNYTNPDLLFDSRNGEKDNRYARIFLNNLSGAEWSETIVIVNHESSASEYADNQAALFIECYLQRKFNLLDS